MTKEFSMMNYEEMKRDLDQGVKDALGPVSAEYQVKLISRCIRKFQSGLKATQDVAVGFANFGRELVMSVEKIYAQGHDLLVFEGIIKGNPSVLIQHVGQLDFLLTTEPKDPKEPYRQIGFTADWGDKD